MEALFGFTLGLIAGGVIGFLYQTRSRGDVKELDLKFFKRPGKKKPVSVSEEEQWKREQKTVPLDPGI